MDMDLQSLKYFKRVAELNSISKAAREFQVVQSAVSTQIKSLEYELGTDLFDRTNNKIELNEKGKVLYKYANRILVLVKDSKKELADANQCDSTTLTISVETIPLLLPHLIQGFNQKYQDIKIKLMQYQKDFDMENMESDIMIYFSENPVEEETAITVYQENILLAVSKENPLANKKTVTWAELENERFINRSSLSELAAVMQIHLDGVNFHPDISVISDYPPLINSLIASNMGIAFLPKLSWLYYDNSNIVLLEIEDFSINRYINITWRKEAYVSKAMKQFIAYTKRFFEEVV